MFIPHKVQGRAPSTRMFIPHKAQGRAPSTRMFIPPKRRANLRKRRREMIRLVVESVSRMRRIEPLLAVSRCAAPAKCISILSRRIGPAGIAVIAAEDEVVDAVLLGLLCERLRLARLEGLG